MGGGERPGPGNGEGLERVVVHRGAILRKRADAGGTLHCDKQYFNDNLDIRMMLLLAI